MISKFILIALLLAMINFVSAEPIGNEYGFANAWFNGQEATVNNAKLKIDEPVTIKLTVTSNVSGHVFVALTNPLVTKPYDVIEGAEIEKSINNLNVAPGWSNTFIWKIKPNGAWVDGNAPINVFVKFYNTQSKDDKKLEFTIANPYILPGRFEGAPTATAPAAAGSVPAVPGYEGALVIAALAGAAVMRGRHL